MNGPEQEPPTTPEIYLNLRVENVHIEISGQLFFLKKITPKFRHFRLFYKPVLYESNCRRTVHTRPRHPRKEKAVRNHQMSAIYRKRSVLGDGVHRLMYENTKEDSRPRWTQCAARGPCDKRNKKVLDCFKLTGAG